MPTPLFAGLKVLDVATVIAGPAAAMMLADFGAEVIKVEQPGAGDMLRGISRLPGTPDARSNYMWHLDGRNKRGLALNLKTPAGMEVLRKLVARCDVYITNQPHSVRESLKLTYEDLRPLNPRMIYASLTAYGERGPERDRRGFDQIAYWARSGLMDLMRQPDAMPTQGLPGMGDHPTAVALYAAIVTALLRREHTGEGGMVHTSLFANGLWSASAVAQGALAGADMADYRAKRRERHWLWRLYRCADRRWLQFNMVRTIELMYLLLATLDATHLLEDERFADLEAMAANSEALGDFVQERIGSRPSDAWMDDFAAVDLPVNRIGLVEEAGADAQALANGMAVPAADTRFEMPLVVNHPVNVEGCERVTPSAAPDLGEHSAEILAELGYDTGQIADLCASGVVETGGA